MKWIYLSVFTLSLMPIILNQDFPEASASSNDTQTTTIEEKLIDTNITSVYLTFFEEDTSNHIGVNYISQTKGLDPILTIQKADFIKRVEGTSKNVTGTPLYVHSFKIRGLEPNSTYHFSTGDDVNGYTKNFKFQTMPSDSSSIEVIQGGDMSTSRIVSKLASKALTKNTRAILIGGDIAYANGKTKSFKKWQSWFSRMNEITISPSGNLLPLILAIGNHETNNKPRSNPLERAPFYFALFPQTDFKTHFLRRFGNHSSLLVLDSGHIKQHADQNRWLEKKLSKIQPRTNKLAMYHAPLYPSHRSFDGEWSKAGREHWLPLFDKYTLSLALENHDHVLKRTYKLKNNQKSSDGTVYIGDGCWGTTPRTAQNRWYLKTSQSKIHLWRLLLSAQGIFGEAVGTDGKLLDNFTISHQKRLTPLFFAGI